MRILANHLSKQHTEVQNLLEKTYRHEIFANHFSQYFKKSDDDFSIMLNIKEEKEFNQVLSDINFIINECLAIIRDQLEENKDKYFSYFKKDKKEKISDLREVKEEFNKSELVKKIKISNLVKEKKDIPEIKEKDIPEIKEKIVFESILFDDVYSDEIDINKYDKLPDNSKRTDFFVYNKKNNQVLVSAVGEKEHLFYNYFNTTLTFPRGDKTISFDLFRTKANFKCFFTSTEQNEDKTKNGHFFDLGGELIDISISKFEDSKRQKICEDIEKHGLNKYIRKFKVKSKDSIYEIRCITIDYMIHDLEVILFSEQTLPWDDPKYGKRLPRLFFLYTCKILQEIAQGKISRNEFESMFNSLHDFCNKIINLTYLSTTESESQVNIFINETLKTFSKTTLYPIFEKLAELVTVKKNMINEKEKNEKEQINSINEWLFSNNLPRQKLSNIMSTFDELKNLAFNEKIQKFINEVLFFGQMSMFYMRSFSDMNLKFFKYPDFLEEEQFGGKHQQSGGKRRPNKSKRMIIY